MNKKQLIKVLTILSIVVFIILFIFVSKLISNTFFYDKYDLPEEVKVEYKNEVELFEDISFQKLITDKNVDILNEDEKINTETVGRKKYRLDIKYNKKKYYYNMAVTVKDVTAPIFITAASTVTTTVMTVA